MDMHVMYKAYGHVKGTMINVQSIQESE